MTSNLTPKRQIELRETAQRLIDNKCPHSESGVRADECIELLNITVERNVLCERIDILLETLADTSYKLADIWRSKYRVKKVECNKFQNERNLAREALVLYRSMVIGNENETKQSRAMYEAAFVPDVKENGEE